MTTSAIPEILVRTGAVSFRTEPFFRFTSGTESPVYVDNRRLLGFVEERRAVVDHLMAAVQDVLADVGVVAGTATAGIPWAAWMADAAGLPLMYVRSEAKRWGHQRAIEGTAPADAAALLVEDLSFTGGSLLAAADHLRDAEHEVAACQTIVTYDMPDARRSFEAKGLQQRSLTTIDAALNAAEDTGLLTADAVSIVERWLREQRQARAQATI